jgi:phage terminase large subunit
MTTVRLPNSWKPRAYQLPLWSYLERGGKRVDACWHRRAGKDDISLNWAAVSAFERPGNIWHMLPEAEQARKAIWAAVNPHTGKRRIDEAFPHEVRKRTREQEMSIEFVNGATWQVVGSDNFNSLVGSTPVGITFSEWSLANPKAWAFMRPILMENNGWAIFIYTPRGKNHAYRMHEASRKNPDWFSQLLTVDDTRVFDPEALKRELAEYIGEHGEEEGESFFRQEYYCSFDAAILGAVYGRWIVNAEKQGRITRVAYDPALPINTAWDLGYDDATAIWWWQICRDEVRLIDYYENSGQDIAHYHQVLESKPYSYKDSNHYVPHDAGHKLLAAGGRSIVMQAWDFGLKMTVVPATSMTNGIAAARKTLETAWFDDEATVEGREALKQYHFSYDSDKKILSTSPVHDWSSHASDAFEIIGQVWQAQRLPKKPEPPKYPAQTSVTELIAQRRRKRLAQE